MKLSDQVYERTKNDIIVCRLKPGDQINQAQLVKKYRTGMMPVREALQRLAIEGYLQVIPRFGYIVKPITLNEVRDIYEVRSIIEPEAARLAAVRASDRQLDEIEQAADMPNASGGREAATAYIVKHNDFHRMVAAASGNQRLLEISSKLIDERMRLFHLGLALIQHDHESSRNDHFKLVQILRKRDPERAAEAFRKHVAGSQEIVLRVLLRHAGNERAESPNLQIQLATVPEIA
jgi:DNA-binding GntR family transcriptional regulator